MTAWANRGMVRETPEGGSKMRWMILLCLIVPAPVAALEICDDLWFTRNLVFHRAGHCFGSVLGKAVFGDEGCNKDGGAPDKDALALIERVRGLEAEFNCDVDTTQDFLAVPVFEQRKDLIDLPFPSEIESACVGWKGGRLALRKAHKDGAELLGAVRDGDTLLFQYQDVGDWMFVEVQQNGIPAGMGWAKPEISKENCEMVAG